MSMLLLTTSHTQMQLNIMAHKEGAKLFHPLNKQADLQVKFFQSSNEAIIINQHQSTVSIFSNPSKLNLATAAIFHIIPTANPYRLATNDQPEMPTTLTESKIIIPQSLENGLPRAHRPENLINFNRLNINSPRASTVSNIVDNMQKGAFAAHLKAAQINEPPTNPTSLFQYTTTNQFILQQLLVSVRMHRLFQRASLAQFQSTHLSPMKQIICLVVFILLMLSATYLLYDRTKRTAKRSTNKKRPLNNKKGYNSKQFQQLNTNLNLSKSDRRQLYKQQIIQKIPTNQLRGST